MQNTELTESIERTADCIRREESKKDRCAMQQRVLALLMAGQPLTLPEHCVAAALLYSDLEREKESGAYWEQKHRAEMAKLQAQVQAEEATAFALLDAAESQAAQAALRTAAVGNGIEP